MLLVSVLCVLIVERLLLKAGDNEVWNRLTIMGFVMAMDLVGRRETTVHAYTPFGGHRI